MGVETVSEEYSQPHDRKAITRVFGVTSERIRQLEKRAVKQLKQAAGADK